MVRKEGLEPTHLTALEPKSSASTNSATFAADTLKNQRALSRAILPEALPACHFKLLAVRYSKAIILA